MPKRSADYMGERREQIIDAALNCALTKGWSRTTVDDVASGAGLSKGAVYIHFANKRALLEGLIERSIVEMEAIAGVTTFEDFRRALLEGMDLLAAPQGQVIAVSQLELQLEGARDPELQEMIRAATARLVEVLTAVASRLRPDLAASEVSMIALGLIFLLDGMRSFRALSDVVSEAQMRAVLERQLESLQP